MVDVGTEHSAETRRGTITPKAVDAGFKIFRLGKLVLRSVRTELLYWLCRRTGLSLFDLQSNSREMFGKQRTKDAWTHLGKGFLERQNRHNPTIGSEFSCSRLSSDQVALPLGRMGAFFWARICFPGTASQVGCNGVAEKLQFGRTKRAGFQACRGVAPL
jgi:hypothetical protein